MCKKIEAHPRNEENSVMSSYPRSVPSVILSGSLIVLREERRLRFGN